MFIGKKILHKLIILKKLNRHLILLDVLLLITFNILELVLKQEQEEYKREGIAWQNIDYFNNQIICDLVEQPHKGMIAIMDEACLNVGKVTDEVSFLNLLY